MALPERARRFLRLVRGVAGLVFAGAGLILAALGTRRAESQPPSQAVPDQAPSPGRRRLLSGMSAAVAGGVGAAVGVPVVGFVLSPLFKEDADVWRPLGPLDDFNVGETVKVTFEDPSPQAWAGRTAHSAAWLRRVNEQQFTAFSINCTHLGCPIRWLAEAELFMCPCHGGVFESDGRVVAGPPPEPLARHETRVLDGQLEIKTRAIKITGNILPGREES